jgi:hypothetical protein
MKKTSIRLVLALGLFAITFGACKKDKDEAVSVTKENLLGSYKLTELKLIVAGQPVDLYTTYLEACQRDDIYKLNADFTVQVNDEGTKCGQGASYSSTWELDGNYIDIDGYSGDVKSFDGKTLVIEGSGSQGGISGTAKAVFVKQ